MSKPEFSKVFPSKKLINRILFQLDSDVTSRTIIPIYRSIYQDKTVPKNYSKNGEVLLLMNQVLSRVKKISNYESSPLRQMRNFLLYESAHNGSNDAVAMLCYEILSNKKTPTDKKRQAEKLLKDLIVVGHGLSFKIVGDLYHGMGQTNECISWYEKFLEQPRLKDELRAEVLEKIAEILYREDIKNVNIAEEKFLEVLKISKLQDCVKSYFYLAQIYIKYDPVKSRVLLEQCCTQGFKEAFKEIGYLEMNYFRDLKKAQEWFKIGMEVFEIECYFGYFDCSYELEQYQNCVNCLNTMKNLTKINNNYRDYINMFVTNRKEKIAIVVEKTESSKRNVSKEEDKNRNSTGTHQNNLKSRWTV
ncbi:hypothetical protein C6P45_002140 [Maudiozyma exigua]|uniref:Uncharacterized protein n=1 Tax=Maudiozyma exigua TaxID=34358 RepID=A0A9P7BCC7_MAUEX|nr:hypothetical protein C6P45_002140 [Kazachstania exigua]